MVEKLTGNQHSTGKRREINHLCMERIRKSLSVNEEKSVLEREKRSSYENSSLCHRPIEDMLDLHIVFSTAG